MKIFKLNTTSNFKIKNINLAIGNFDGVHIAHQKIIKKLVLESKKMKVKSAILSFSPHPRQYFNQNYENFNIINEDTKINLFKDLNVDYFIIFKFNIHLASLTPEKFIENILYKMLKIRHLTVGYDFKFGKDRKGNIDLLKLKSQIYNFNISIINQIINKKNAEIYSSSLIRKYIVEGNFKKVSNLLSRNWSMTGKVIFGNQKASKMNFPTANIVPGNHIKPKKGVYAIRVRLKNKYHKGIANFGERPTIGGKKLLLEVHIFDFSENIYGKELTVEFLTFIRDEKKFDNFSLLVKQIKKDIQLVKKYHLKD